MTPPVGINLAGRSQPEGGPGVLAQAAAALKTSFKTAVGSPLAWRLLSPLRPAGVAILTYHRIGVPDDPFPHVDIGVFRRHMELAMRLCDVIAPENLRSHIEEPGPRRALLVTFDDGFRGYYDHVYPVLKEMGIPSVVFVTTGLVDDPSRLLWADMAFLAVHRGNHRAPIALPWRPAERYDLTAPRERTRFLQAFKAGVKAVAEEEKASHLEWLVDTLGYQPPNSRQMLSWDEVRATMPLTTYAGHSHTHPILSRVSDDRLEEEIRLSKERITQETGRAPRWFAYPNGQRADFDERCGRALARHGFDTAFTTEPGINGRDTDWMAVRRLASGMSPMDLAWELSGLRWVLASRAPRHGS